MSAEKELMLKQADAETTYQKKLTAGTNITIDPVTNVISSAGGGSTVQYTDNVPNGESVGILAINGQSHPIRIPRLAEGTGITITKDISTNVYTISSTGGGSGTTKSYMGKTDPDELVGEDGDLYFKYHKIETDVPTELTLPSLPDDVTVPFPINNFNSYDSFTFYCTDPSLQTTTINLNIGDIPIGDNPAELTPESEIHRFNTFYYAQVSRSTDGEGLVFRVGRNVLFKLEANVTEVDLGIDKSYAKVEDTWLPSGEQVEANPEETSETPLTKIKIDGVTYYIAAGGSAEIVPLTKAEWDALPASKYTDNILYLITDSFTAETIITPNPEGEATDTLTKLQIDETIYSLAGGSGAAAIEKTQAEYNALTPEQKENGAIYMVQDDGGIGNYEYHTNQAETIVVRVNKTTDEIEWFFVDYTFAGGSVEHIPSELMAYLPASTISGNAYDTSLQTMMGYAAINAQGGFGLYPTDYSREISGTVKCLLKNTDGTEQANTYTDPYEGTGDAVNKIYYMGTEYANTNGGSGGGEGYEETVLWTGTATASNTILALSDSITNYDDLLIYGATIFDSNGTITTQLNTTQIIPVSQIEYGVADEITKGYMYNVSHGQAIRRAVMIFTDASHFVVSRGGENDTTECGFTKVVGIKYGSGGGSSIIPNPEEEPTDTLNSVKIDGTVYNIESSSEGEGIEIYSTEEYIVGKWIDGKNVYQRTYTGLSAQTSGTSWTHISTIDTSTWNEAIDCEIYRTLNGKYAKIPLAEVSTNVSGITDLAISIASSAFDSVITALTVRYTKTVETDAPAWGGSVNNYYANFIDTDNVIYSTVSSSASDTYTATEDCYIMQDIVVGTNVATVQIDGETVAEYSFSGTQLLSYNAYLKKGQTITVTHGATSAHTIKVFGITYASGSSSSGSSVHYFTTEQIIGTWLNNKPLYQKTYENLNIGTDQNYSLTLSDLQNIEYLRVVPEGSQVSATVPFPYTHYNSNNNISYFIDSITNGIPTLAIRKGSEMSSQSNLQFLTIQYTKTTD